MNRIVKYVIPGSKVMSQNKECKTTTTTALFIK